MEVRERNINVWLPLMHPKLGTWPATQAHALTGNRTSDPLVHRPALNPLSHTSQESLVSFKMAFMASFAYRNFRFFCSQVLPTRGS